jgi:RHS repeat-associated protein
LQYGGVDGARQKYTSYERDDETGLDYAHARYYGSVQGRFTSPDPFAGSATIASPQTFNRYAYVGNNPTNLTDPTGLFVENTNPHNANTFCGNGDDTVGSHNMDGGSGNEFAGQWARSDASSSTIAHEQMHSGLGSAAGQTQAPQEPAHAGFPRDLNSSQAARVRDIRSLIK